MPFMTWATHVLQWPPTEGYNGVIRSQTLARRLGFYFLFILSINNLRSTRGSYGGNLFRTNFSSFSERRSRKEVLQPHLPVRLPCYDLAPITSFTLGRSSRLRTSGTPGFHGLTGGVYKARERIHRAVADARLLANPASWSRVADSNPN